MNEQETSENRNSFIFYRSFQEAIEEANDKEQLEIYRTIARYALDHEEPVLESAMAKMAWRIIKPLLDANWKRWVNGCKGKEHGVKGGAPIGNQNATKTTPKQPQNNPNGVDNSTPNDKCIMNNDKCIITNKERVKEKRDAFSIPTLEEVKSYILEKEFSVDAGQFIDYYESNGWYVGKNKMKNWKAAISTWEKRGKDVFSQKRTSDSHNNCNDEWK